MMQKFDWNAPVEPGRGMLDLRLGLSLNGLRSLLGEAGNVMAKTPKLAVDYKNEQPAVLRAMSMPNCQYDWQNIMARMMFEDGCCAAQWCPETWGMRLTPIKEN